MKRKTDFSNQITEPNELNTSVLQTPLPGKGGKAKKTPRSAKSNKSGTQASGSNAGEFVLNALCQNVFTFYLHWLLLVAQ